VRQSREAKKKPGQARIDATALAVIDCAADPIIALGKDKTVCVWNRAAEEMFGWRVSDVLGLEPPIIPKELRAEHHAVLERVINGTNVSLATRRICKAGEVLDVRIDTSELVDSAGERLGWISVCHRSEEDATVRHYMAERARLVRRLGDVVADMNAELDLESVLDRIAASLRELTKADAGGFVLIEGDQLRLVSMDGLPADLRGRIADLPSSLVGELMRSGNSVLMRTGQFDDLIWSALPGLHTITVSLSHVGGKPYGALYALYSRRQVGHIELELLELLAGHASVALSNATAFSEVVSQRAHERAVIDGSADGIAVLDGDGMVRQWNRAAHALTGISAAQVTGKPPPFPLPEPGATLSYKLPNNRWVDVLCTVLEGRDEQVIDFRDVTAAKELEEAKDLFLATTSHELRTPITVVQGFASTLANRWDKMLDVDRRGAVQTIAERAESLGRLVDQLLLGSRAGAKRLTVKDEPFDLGRVLSDTARVFQPLADKHVLVAEIPADLPAAHGDPAATDSIVGQLLENAFKYSPDGGTIAISARVLPEADGARADEAGADEAGAGLLEVAVRDEGIGIAAADLERVFERFVQGEAGDRRRFGGIGLGLYIVRQLARAQGGEVTAVRRDGGGTEMRLTLRRSLVPLPREESDRDQAEADGGGSEQAGLTADRFAARAGRLSGAGGQASGGAGGSVAGHEANGAGVGGNGVLVSAVAAGGGPNGYHEAEAAVGSGVAETAAGRPDEAIGSPVGVASEAVEADGAARAAEASGAVNAGSVVKVGQSDQPDLAGRAGRPGRAGRAAEAESAGAGSDEARSDEAGPGEAGSDEAGPDEVRPNEAGSDDGQARDRRQPRSATSRFGIWPGRSKPSQPRSMLPWGVLSRPGVPHPRKPPDDDL
jgi:PAS domain S-box-containing protein